MAPALQNAVALGRSGEQKDTHPNTAPATWQGAPGSRQPGQHPALPFPGESCRGGVPITPLHWAAGRGPGRLRGCAEQPTGPECRCPVRPHCSSVAVMAGAADVRPTASVAARSTLRAPRNTSPCHSSLPLKLLVVHRARPGMLPRGPVCQGQAAERHRALAGQGPLLPGPVALLPLVPGAPRDSVVPGPRLLPPRPAEAEAGGRSPGSEPRLVYYITTVRFASLVP